MSMEVKHDSKTHYVTIQKKYDGPVLIIITIQEFGYFE